jgi:hypothetical protein
MLARHVLQLSLFGIALPSLSGCVALVQYTPDEGLAARLGEEEALRKLKEVIHRALEPRFADVQVSIDEYVVTYLQGWHPYYYGPVGPIPIGILYRNVSRVDIYENHKVFVYDVNGVEKQWILFANAQDARLFADLVCSLRARALGGSNEAAKS